MATSSFYKIGIQIRRQILKIYTDAFLVELKKAELEMLEEIMSRQDNFQKTSIG